ncbi:hypothetical protein PMZ80_010968 [Knufia obscura]|nr:hypothetical protein PMZ80_010968 [Knufia obscura]
MMLKASIATAILATLASAAPVFNNARSPKIQDGSVADVAASQYLQFYGDGSADAGWPEKSSWIDFQTMFDTNAELMKQSCSNNQYGADNTDDEIGMIYWGIQNAAEQTHVDQRFILAVIMQESGGCVRVHTTQSWEGVLNPGLMQDHAGTHSCNWDGNTQYPCPQEQIYGMILDGTAGTSAGDGLAGLIGQAVAHNQASGTGADESYGQVYYQAARLYNSGSTSPIWSDLNNGNGATADYANKIANRLLGWIG